LNLVLGERNSAMEFEFYASEGSDITIIEEGKSKRLM
jgi:hypothetical protein